MAEPIEFYFDFTNPYAYFTSLNVDEIGKRHHRDTVWRPVFASVHSGQDRANAPDQAQAAQAEYAMRDIARVARLHRLELNVQHPLVNSRASDIAYVWLFDQAPRVARNFAEAIFNAHWRLGQNINDPDIIGDCAAAAGQDPAPVTASVGAPSAKQRLDSVFKAGLEKGVFTAPTIVVDGELFCGWDRMAMSEAWLEHGGW